jgi:hypothetical protein
VATLEADRDRVHARAFNVGRTEENYRISEIAAMVEDVVPGSNITYAEGGGPDIRCYRVNCDEVKRLLPEFQPVWTVRRGIEELYEAFLRHRLSLDDFTGSKLMRLRRVKELQELGEIDESLRWRTRRNGVAPDVRA